MTYGACAYQFNKFLLIIYNTRQCIVNRLNELAPERKLKCMFTIPLSTIQGETIAVTEHNPT